MTAKNIRKKSIFVKKGNFAANLFWQLFHIFEATDLNQKSLKRLSCYL